MERLFQKSVKRSSICLNGQWNITFDPDNNGESLGYPEGKALSGDPVYVPSCWNFDMGRYDYMGCVWYSRTFVTPIQKNSRLIFHAVSGEAVVYLDGQKLGSHYGSYNKFWFDVPDMNAGSHQIVVKVDNTVNDKDTLPLDYVDWFVYGGIYRGVELEQFNDISIDHIQINTEWEKYEVSEVKARVFIKNWSRKKVVEKFVLSIDNEQKLVEEVSLSPGKTSTIVFDPKGFSPKLWDTENANLYMFQVSCSTDDLCERTGFRKIETQGKKILLNGKEIFIKGINRHNDNPELGYAISGPLILRDMQIIKDLGCNSVRGSHYPNDPVVLDYCDQMGLLFWGEVAFWNHPAESLANPLLEKRSRQMMREMITQDYNHPSIIIWSIQNESKSSSQEGLELFTKLAEDIRSMDKSRLVSYASACGRDDICFDLVDIVCWNMYPGWYDDQSLDNLEQRFSKSLNSHREWLTENGQNKPFMVTEFGAGAVPGEKTFDKGRRWTENYQEELLTKNHR